MSKQLLSGLLVLLLTFASGGALAAPMVVIDFETDGSGDPWSPAPLLLPPDEYASRGVTITGSQNRVFLASLVNVGTSPAQGFVIQDGAVAGVDTFIDLTFDPGITSVAFDWYSSTRATSISVSVFDLGGSSLESFSDPSDSTFIVEGSPQFVFAAGSFSLDLGGTPIGRIRVEDQPIGTHAVGLENLAFTQIPEPATALLLGCGMAGLALRRRHP